VEIRACACLVVSLLIGHSVRAVEKPGDVAQAIVAKAIRAAGGKDRLTRYRAETWKETAVYHGDGGDDRYEASYSAEWPDRFKVEIGDFTMVLTGDTGWVKAQGNRRRMTREEIEEHAEGVYSLWVLSLLPLESEGFKLSVLGEAKVGGRATEGVRVSHEGHYDVNLYFDRETHLLAMSETRFKEANSGRDVKQEMVFSGYKDVSGIKSPTRVSITRNGKLAVEASVELTHLEDLDDRVFAKP
jgi:hypothetical protein